MGGITQHIDTDNIINALLSKGLVLIKKTDLEELISEVSIKNMVDNRVKYISHKKAIKMYGITDYWLKKQREKPDTLLKSIPGENKNSSWKYQIKSIEDELDRLSI